MNILNRAIQFRAALFLLGLALLSPVSAQAHDVYLAAQSFTQTLPDGVQVEMWGYAEANADFSVIGAPTSPGPVIRVPEGDSVLNIHLRNDLAVPSSVIVPSLNGGALAPVRDGSGRVVSFAAEAAPAGGMMTYSYDARPGTFLYQSGTHVQIQVQMGLVGAVVQNFAAGQIYEGQAEGSFDNEALLVYSEIDPVIHDAITAGEYGPGKMITSTIDYRPRYFLINGEPAPLAEPIWDHAATAGERVLVRFVNAGLKIHAPLVHGIWGDLLSQDGFPAPFPQETYSILLGAGQTADFAFDSMEMGSIPIFDRRCYLVNAAMKDGGLYASLEIGEGTGTHAQPLSFDKTASRRDGLTKKVKPLSRTLLKMEKTRLTPFSGKRLTR